MQPSPLSNSRTFSLAVMPHFPSIPHPRPNSVLPKAGAPPPSLSLVQGFSLDCAPNQLCLHVALLFLGLRFSRCTMRSLDHKMFPKGLYCSYTLPTNCYCKQGVYLGWQSSILFLPSLCLPSLSFISPAISLSPSTTLHTPPFKSQRQLSLFQEAQ